METNPYVVEKLLQIRQQDALREAQNQALIRIALQNQPGLHQKLAAKTGRLMIRLGSWLLEQSRIVCNPILPEENRYSC